MNIAEWKILGHGVTQHRPETIDAWHELRANAVTASQAGALLGVHEYTTLYEMWAAKSGLMSIAAAPQDTAVMERGELLEDDAIEMIHRRHPDWQIVHNVIPGGLYLEDQANRLGATPDAFAIIDGEASVIQIKTTDPYTFKQKWQQGDGIEPPLWIAVQAMLEAYLAGARKAHVAVLSVGRTLDLHTVEVPIVAGVIKRLQQMSRLFWDSVVRGVPPDPDYTRDGEAIAALMPHDHGTEVDLGDDNEFCATVAERQRLKGEMESLGSALGRCDALIKHRMGTHAVASIPGYRVTYRTQTRKAYSVKACEFRKLTVTEDEP